MQRVEAAEWIRMRADTAQQEFETFFCAHREAILSLTFAITGDHDSASDATQEAFVKVLDKWKRVREMESPEAFLKKVAARCSIDHLRSRSRTEPERDQAVSTTSDNVAVRQALSKLKPDQQAILALSVGEGWSYAEISEAMKIPEGTVASRIHAAKEAFRRQWGDER